MNKVITNVNPPGRILLASLVGTTIEFFDFYIYATAAVLVFPELFFPQTDPTSATLESLATFALAFFANMVISGQPENILPNQENSYRDFGDRVSNVWQLILADRN